MQQLPGPISVDLWLNCIRDGIAFVRGIFLGASVGNFSEVQLVNPAGSGVQVIVYSIAIGQPSSTLTQTYLYDTALATDAGAGVNLLLGSAPGLAHVHTSQPGAPDGTLISQLNRPTASDSNRYWGWVCELAAGKGVYLAPDAANASMSVEYQWIELPA